MSIRDLVPRARQENRAPMLLDPEDRNPFLSLRREMDRMFDDVLRGFGGPSMMMSRMTSWPSVEVSETDSEFRIIAEVPGLSEKDIELTVDDGMLCIRGERRSESEAKDRGYSERFYGRFERRIALPSGAEEEKASARFEDGVLTVTIPRSAEVVRGRRIPISAGTRH